MTINFSLTEARMVVENIFTIVEFVWAMIGSGYLLKMINNIGNTIKEVRK